MPGLFWMSILKQKKAGMEKKKKKKDIERI